MASCPSVNNLYWKYISEFRTEVDEVVGRMTPHLVAYILSQSIKNRENIQFRKSKFPELSEEYIKSVIKTLLKMRITGRKEESHCVFFIPNDNSENAFYARGLVSLNVIADVISSRSGNIKMFLPSTMKNALREIEKIAINNYKLECSRLDYVDSISRELMEIVTVLLPKSNTTLETASRMNAIASPIVSRRVTPLLFMGTMMALAGATSTSTINVSKPSTKALVDNSGTEFVSAFHGLLESVTGGKSIMPKMQENSRENTLNIHTMLEDYMGVNFKTGFEIPLEPVTEKIHQVEGIKLVAFLQKQANNIVGMDITSSAQRRSIMRDLSREYENILRRMDPGTKVFLYDDEISGYKIAIPDYTNTKNSVFIPMNSYLKDVEILLMAMVDETCSNVKDKDNSKIAWREEQNQLKNVVRMGVGSKLVEDRMKNTRIREFEEQDQLTAVLPQERIDDIRDHLSAMSIITRTDVRSDKLVYINPCPEGHTCKNIVYAIADPKDVDRSALAQSIVATASGLNPYGKGVTAKEVRSGEADRYQFNNDPTYTNTFIEDRSLEEKSLLSYNMDMEGEILHTTDIKSTTDLLVEELKIHQNMNIRKITQSEISPSQRETLLVTVWNSIENANPAEITSLATMQEFFKSFFQKSLSIDGLLEVAKSFIDGMDPSDLDKKRIDTKIRTEIRKRLPELITNVLKDKMEKHGIDMNPLNLQRAFDNVSEGKDTKFTQYLKSKPAAYIFNEFRASHQVLTMFPFFRWVSILNGEDASKEIGELVKKVEMAYSGIVDTNMTFDLNDKDTAKILAVMRHGDLSKEDYIGLGDIDELYNATTAWFTIFLNHYYTLIEIVISIGIITTMYFGSTKAGKIAWSWFSTKVREKLMPTREI